MNTHRRRAGYTRARHTALTVVPAMAWTMTIAAILLATPVFAQTPPNAAVPRSTDVLPMDGPLKTQLTNASFAENAMAISLAIIEMAEMTKAKTSNEKITQFAQQQRQQQTAINKRLKQIAENEVGLKFPPELADTQQKIIAELKSKNGNAFDLAYIELMKSEYDTLVGMFDKASAEPEIDGRLRKFAVDTLPTIRQHQEMIHSSSNVWIRRP